MIRGTARGRLETRAGRRRAAATDAFTLFELLVTMAVISVLVGVGFYSIARSTDDRALERGADMLHSMVRVARTQAITNGVHARLIINADPSDTESYMRQIGVVIEHADSKKWVAVDRGAYLPEGIYVVPQAGQVVFPSGWPASGRKSIYKISNTADAGSAVYFFDYPMLKPVSDAGTQGSQWICIQFAPNGRLSAAVWGGHNSVPKSNRIVLTKGTWSGSNIRIHSASDVIGIVFKITGQSIQTTDVSLL